MRRIFMPYLYRLNFLICISNFYLPGKSFYQLLTVIILLFSANVFSQPSVSGNPAYLKGIDADVYGTSDRFIENIGQYGDYYDKFPEMGRILYAYEGFGVPVLFTEKGLIYLHRKIEKPKLTEAEKEEREHKKIKKEDEIGEMYAEDRAVKMEWQNSNSLELVPGKACTEYHTYGSLPGKAKAYQQITIPNLYPGIDVVYSFRGNKQPGFEYSLLVKAGADLQQVRMKYGGDIKSVKLDDNGNLLIRSEAGTTEESLPHSYYGDAVISPGKINDQVRTGFLLNKKEVGFGLPTGVDHSKGLVIDPFVSSVSNLTGTGVNAGIAKDVDFDYAGNVYVTGGGNGSVYKLAKFDANGVLQWTFNGALTIPSWNFGTYYGGWVVEKTTGNIYLGQGFAPAGGHRVIRINTTGLYDNYITTANPSFLENWKMYWNCNNGSPQLFIAGGGTNSNINFGVCAPPSTVVSSLNVTGIPYSPGTGWAQDISDVIIDPANNALYTIYGSLYGTPSLSNKIYRNNPPYSGASVVWSVYSGLVSIQEIANRPYLAGPEIDNSSNVLAINSSYLFYWDGKNLEAIDKNTGAVAGSPLTVAANSKLMCGGIIADECNNIFCGSANGTIKVFYFNGSTFDDAARPDITIPGFPGSAVYDLAFYESQKLLYASGNGFVASFDVSSYNCAPNYFTISVSGSCATLSATASISPSPPSGSVVTYILYSGTTQLATNTTGIFTGLTPNTTYNIKAIVNQVCSGAVTTSSFTLPGPVITPAITNTVCGSGSGSVTISVSGGTPPYTYSIDGTNFQPGNTFNGLSSGYYTVTAKDVNGCYNTAIVNIRNTNGPSVTYTKTNAACGSNTGTITAQGSGGVAPLSYSINGTTFQTNNFFTGILAGNYILIVKDANGCTNATSVTITNAPGPTVSAIPATTFCNTANGSITAIASGGTAPLEYSINANIYQSSNVFNNLPGGAYTVTVRDANNCLATANTNVPNSTGPTVSATVATATCSNANGSITANGTGGVAPLQYSINGINFQFSNFFYGLTAGTYVITVKDANNCTNTVTATVNSTNGPAVTASATASACSSNTGTITASGIGGTGLLQYSINGITFQSSTFFSGLAPNTYTVLVRDANGCFGAAIVTVPNTAAPSVTASVTASSCGTSDGVINASGSGGTSPYQYSLDGINFQGSNVFNGLSPGNYTLTIKDQNGCKSSIAVSLSNIAGLSLTPSIVSSSCSSNNGSISANGSGGVAPLQYSINGSTWQSGHLFTGLAGGNYTIFVKDANGCIVTTTATLITLLAPTLTVTFTDANCNGGNGSITASGSGGTPPYQYSIDGTNFQGGGLFIGLAAGNYTVYLKDAASCIQTFPVTLSTSGAGGGINTFTVRTKYYPCNGDITGDITNPRVNGSNCGSCTFSLNSGPYISNATQLYTGLSPGTYTLTAKDANGCTKTIFVSLIPNTVSTASVVVTGTTCNGSSGSIKLTGIGPNTPYHASISGIGGPWITFDPNYTFTGLAPGTYEIILADDESFDAGPPILPGGCLDTLEVIVPSTDGPLITTTKTNGSCRLNDGTITASGSGGTAPLDYSLDFGPFQSSGLFTGLGTGIYQVDVIDANGCVNTKFDTITNPPGPSVTAVATPASCGLVNGVITATGNGGTAPLQYSINGTVYQTSNIFSGLAAGTYTVRVGDASLCISSTTVTITNTTKPSVTAYSVSASCNQSNGLLIANGTNGTAPYQFSLDSITYQSSNQFSGLDAGLYTVFIKDGRGCINSTNISMVNLGAPSVTLSSTPATCLNSNGSITANGIGGTAPLNYSINDTAYQASNIFTGLAAGSYTVFVRDANGCKVSKNILVSSPNIPQSLSATVTNTSCGNNNGSILASASGGVAPLQYSINGTTFQSSTSFTSLAAGSYTLTVKDANGCTKSIPLTITNLAGPALTTSATLSSCFAHDGTISVFGSGGTGVLTYSINGVTFQNSPIFNGLSPGTYKITIKDSKGCTASDSNIVVAQVAGPNIISIFDTVMACGGSITATVINGAPPYHYNINNEPYQDSATFSCRPPSGLTMLHVVDANGCSDSIGFLFDSSAIGLPVELINFTGHTENGYNILEWATASELNSDYFLLERSADGLTFEYLLEKKAAGNSREPCYYTARDDHPFPVINYYRLKEFDLDGSFQTSHIIHLHALNAIGFYYSYNPESNELTVIVNGLPDDQKEIELFDVAGNIVFNTFSKDNSYKISTAHFAKGMYLLRIRTESAEKNIKLEIY